MQIVIVRPTHGSQLQDIPEVTKTAPGWHQVVESVYAWPCDDADTARSLGDQIGREAEKVNTYPQTWHRLGAGPQTGCDQPEPLSGRWEANDAYDHALHARCVRPRACLGVDGFLPVSCFEEHIAILARFPCAFFPRLHLSTAIRGIFFTIVDTCCIQ